MKNKTINQSYMIINSVSTGVFAIMFLGGLGRFFDYLQHEGPLDSGVIAAACLFLVGAFGLIIELVFFNMTSIKNHQT